MKWRKSLFARTSFSLWLLVKEGVLDEKIRGKSEKIKPFHKLSKKSNTWLLKFLQINRSPTTSSPDEPPQSDQQEGRTCTTTWNDPELIYCTKQRMLGEHGSFIIFSKPVLVLYTFYRHTIFNFFSWYAGYSTCAVLQAVSLNSG